MATLLSGVTIWTYHDLVEMVLDAHDIERTGLAVRRARGSILQAYDTIPYRHPWSYYFRQRLLQTVASYGTGTVAFTFATRQLTLTGGTWPAWAAFGHVIIGNVHYDVEDRTSNSVITLTASSNPGADVSSTSYQIYRSEYPLPADFNQLSRLWDIEGGFPIHFVDEIQQHVALQRLDRVPGSPRRCTIRASGKYQGLRELVFGPPPSTSLTYDFFYHAAPRPLAIEDYSSGTVAVTSATTTVTGSSTTFPANCAGSIIRFAATTCPTKPSSALGSIDGADNPFVFEDVIKSYTSATSIELTSAAPQSLTGSGYVISDPLDIEPRVMLTAFQRHAEAEFSRKSGRPDAPARIALARQALLEAMEADVPFDPFTGTVLYNPFKRAPIITDAG